MDHRFDRLEARLNELDVRLIAILAAVDALTARQRNQLIRTGQPFPFRAEHTSASASAPASALSSSPSAHVSTVTQGL